MEWIKCNDKTVLPVGEYVLKIKRFGSLYNSVFTVKSYQIKREIHDKYAIAYMILPNYNG